MNKIRLSNERANELGCWFLYEEDGKLYIPLEFSKSANVKKIQELYFTLANKVYCSNCGMLTDVMDDSGELGNCVCSNCGEMVNMAAILTDNLLEDFGIAEEQRSEEGYYLYNSENLRAEKLGTMLEYSSDVIRKLIENTLTADFDVESLENYKFRLLDGSSLNGIKSSSAFTLNTISSILQVWKEDMVVGYIHIIQVEPYEKMVHLEVVNSASSDIVRELCRTYTKLAKAYAEED